MVPTAVPLLVISGSMGTGKTTVLSEASDVLSEAGIAHAAIDLDWLASSRLPKSAGVFRVYCVLRTFRWGVLI